MEVPWTCVSWQSRGVFRGVFRDDETVPWQLRMEVPLAYPIPGKGQLPRHCHGIRFDESQGKLWKPLYAQHGSATLK